MYNILQIIIFVNQCIYSTIFFYVRGSIENLEVLKFLNNEVR